MLNHYFYLKMGSLGMDQYGRFTDNVRTWQVYADRQVVFRMMENYPGSTVGIL